MNHGELGRRAAGYHSSRAEAVQSVQKTIGELAQMFQKCLGMARCGAWLGPFGARFFKSVYHHKRFRNGFNLPVILCRVL